MSAPAIDGSRTIGHIVATTGFWSVAAGTAASERYPMRHEWTEGRFPGPPFCWRHAGAGMMQMSAPIANASAAASSAGAGRFTRRRFARHRSFGLDGLARGSRPRRGTALLRGGFRLFRQCRTRCRAPTFPLQRGDARPRAFRRRLGAFAFRALGHVANGFLSRFGALSLARWRQTDPGATRLGQSDSNRLLRVARTVLAFAHVMDLLAHEFSRLCCGRLAFALVLLCSFQRLFLRHADLLEENDTLRRRKMHADRISARSRDRRREMTARMSRFAVRSATRRRNLCNESSET